MNNYLGRALSLCLLLSLASCSSYPPPQKKVLGAAVGGAAGAGLGASSGAGASVAGPITMTGLGAMIGALMGSTYGAGMEGSDKAEAYKALAAGEKRTWQNPGTRVTYTIIPAAKRVTVNGNPNCRDFVATQTTPDGSVRKLRQRACEAGQGVWDFVRKA